MKAIRVVVVSVALCVLVGVPIGTVVAGVISGVPLLPFGVDIAGVPILVYAFVTGSPIAAVGGVLGGVVLLALLQLRSWHPPWYGWVLAGSFMGAMLSGIPAGILLSVGDALEVPDVFRVLGLVATTGAICGALLGLYGWLERKRPQRAVA